MPTVEVTIINRLGLHARAAAKFVQAASRYGSEISVERDDKTVNGKSIMGVMMLAASQGTTLKISATGDDADAALSEIVGLINSRFGEPS
ncbi:MAG: HPr family phosphocarrier protein [Gammaproteobacteria bacterium]